MSESKKEITKRCPECGRRFKQTREWQKFDTYNCRLNYWVRTHPRISSEALEKLVNKTAAKMAARKIKKGEKG
jgi:protein-arginine kinase activator protein McsA